MAQRFPPEVHAFIAANVEGKTARQLADMVNERFGPLFNESTMRVYKVNHHLKSGTPCGFARNRPTKQYPAEVFQYIMDNYIGCPPSEMVDRVNKLFGTSYTAAQIRSFYKNHHLNCGLSMQFEKGNIPHNKGKKGVCAPGCEKTWFQKGILPHNTRPIGWERVTPEGYIQVKVKMRPSRQDCNDNFEMKHRLVWQQHNGPIPDGCIVTFLDGNPKNCDISNLALVTRSERLLMARRGLVSEDPTLTELGIAIAKLRVATRKAKTQGKRPKNQQPT